MANGYTAVPAVIPGPLQVNGLLTVFSDQGIRIGGSPPFVRLYKGTAPNLGLSFNLATDEVTRDITSQQAFAQQMFSTTRTTRVLMVNNVGTAFSAAVDHTFAQDGAIQTNTGNTVENTMHSKVIPANMLGNDGAMMIEWTIIGTVQGGVATTFRIKRNASVVSTFVKTATSAMMVRAFLIQNAANNAMSIQTMVFDSVTGFGYVNGSDIVSTAADVTLSVSIQSGANTDSWNDGGWKVSKFVGTLIPI